MIRRIATLHCDGDDGQGCGQWFDDGGTDDVRTKRTLARNRGWTRSGGLDLCPSCTISATAKTRAQNAP